MNFFNSFTALFRIRVFFGSGSNFFSESGSGKNPDPIRIHEKNVQKMVSTGTSRKKMLFYIYTVFFGHVPPKPNQKHNYSKILLVC